MSFLTKIISPITAVRIVVGTGAFFGLAAGTYSGLRHCSTNIENNDGQYHPSFGYAAAAQAIEGLFTGALIFPYPLFRIYVWYYTRAPKKIEFAPTQKFTPAT